MLQCFGLKLAAHLLGTTKQIREDRLSSKCFLKISVILVVSSVPKSHPINKVHRTLPVQHASTKYESVSQCMRLQGYMF